MNKNIDQLSDPAFARNYGFWNEAEQQSLLESKVAIAGAGGDGFQLGVKLAMMGVKNINVADPEVFELENSNRVLGATSKNLGRNKAEVFRDLVLDLRPNAKVDIFTDGVTQENVGDFMKDADLVIDESELTTPEIGTMIAREARERKIPVEIVMNIGWAAVVTSFRSEGGKTFEKMMSIPENATIDEVSRMKVDFSRCLPYILSYGDIDTLISVKNGANLPSISPGVDVASAIGSVEAFLHLTKDIDNHRRTPTYAPKYFYMDAYSGESGIIRFPRASYYIGVIAAALGSKLNINPKSYYNIQRSEK